MVVPVLITYCQFSEKWNIGPRQAQTSTVTSAPQKASGDPAQRVT